MGATRVVLCDLGGVLIDYSWELALQAWARVASTSPESIKHVLSHHETLVRFEIGSCTESDVLGHFRDEHGLTLPLDAFVKGWNDVFLGANAAVSDILWQLHREGTRLVAVTNTNPLHQAVWSARYASDMSVFSAVYASCEIAARKPDAAFFDHVLAAERLRAEHALFIDDMEENVHGAEQSGIPALHYSDPLRLRSDLVRLGLLRSATS